MAPRPRVSPVAHCDQNSSPLLGSTATDRGAVVRSRTTVLARHYHK